MTTTRLNLATLLPGHPAQEDSCTAHLKDVLSRQPGVQMVALELSPGSAALAVQHSSDAFVGAALEGLGQRLGQEVQTRFKHQALTLGGLHCKDCAAKVESVVGRVPGVLSIEASYALEKADILYDTTQVDLPRVKREITALGYRVEAPAANTELGAEAEEAPPARFTLPREMLLALASGALLLIGWLGAVLGSFPASLSLVFYLAAYAFGGYDVATHAFKAARKGRFDIDSLMLIAALGAGALGEWAEGALLLFLFSLGHALEHYAMNRSRNAIRALGKLTPKTARVERAGVESMIPVTSLSIGDRVIVRAGERLPADGRVVSGESGVDQAPITGESVPVSKGVGDTVFAGTINGDGTLVIETSKNPEDSTLSRVIKLVEEAQGAKSPTQRFTERFERILVPVILVVTVLVIILPPLFGVAFETSFIRAMTLLVAASPCALALATPSAVLAGVARAARSGVLIKGGAHLEAAGTAKVVAFDKTGTLTQGKPQLTDFVTNEDESRLLARVAAAESRSTHPLAAALVREAESRGLTLPAVGTFEALKGRGIRAQVEENKLYIGNERLMAEAGIVTDEALTSRKVALETEGKTVMIVAQAGQSLGLLAVRDEPRPEARAMLAALKNRGVERIVMLTGDNRSVAEAIARELGVDEVQADLLPEDKLTAIKALRERYGKVIMVGDGVNDAPAMAEASVGVAMGGAGTDVALETADIALMGDDLSKFPYALALSRASRRMIVQNLLISLGVIALLVPSALLGFAGVGLAVVLHESSTLVVVLNALRLLGFRDRRAEAETASPLKGQFA